MRESHRGHDARGRDATLEIPRTLVVTGHFPPEPGGVQTFTWELIRRLPAAELLVVAPAWPGAGVFDAGLDFPVVRRHGYLLFHGLRRLVRRHRPEVAWIPAMAPFGLYAPLIRAAGVPRIVASTHGQEIGWTRVPPTRLALSAASRSIDTMTYLSETTFHELRPAVAGRTDLVQLAGGADASRFAPAPAADADADADAVRSPHATDPAGDGVRERPGPSGDVVRRRHELGAGPVVLSVSRLVRRKGHDVLMRAWADVARRRPRARLVIVGDGPTRAALADRAAREFPGSVVIAGPVPDAELPAYYAAADAFILPCRDARRGLQTEGLGLSTLEASASGLPVVVGRSGGSPQSVLDGRTGLLIDARRPAAVAGALLDLLNDPAGARAMGAAGRRWVRENWTWDRAAERLAALLRGEAPDGERRAPVGTHRAPSGVRAGKTSGLTS